MTDIPRTFPEMLDNTKDGQEFLDALQEMFKFLEREKDAQDDTAPTTEIPCQWDSHGEAVDWIRLRNVHNHSDTCDQSCVIHNPTDHHMSRWPLLWRDDRAIFERLCKHGIGHPDPDQNPYWNAADQAWQGRHGCDGCCHE